MPLSLQLTIVPKERAQKQQQQQQQQTTTGEEPSEPTTDKSQQIQPPKDRGQGFSDEPATATPRHSLDDSTVELDLKDLEVSGPKRSSSKSAGVGALGGSSNRGMNFRLGSSSKASITHDPIDDEFYELKLSSTGKFSRKATLTDIAIFAGLETVNSDTLIAWLQEYMKQNFPTQLSKPNCIPRSAHIQDDPKKGFSAFEPYGWQVIKLNVQPGLIEIKDQHTEEVTLEQFQLNYETDIDKALMQHGDKEVVSYLKKGPLKGHPLAVHIFQKRTKLQEDSKLLTEFHGMDGVGFQLGNNQCKAELNEETGELLWKDTKKLRALLHGKPLPRKTGKGVSRTVDILALESYIKARVYYKTSFSGSVSTDHGNDQFDGRRYWNWELKYLLRYNGIPNAQVMYQDIEVKFYSRIQYAMDNEDWEWVNKGGVWLKQKLTSTGGES